jgi:hypothetical protein
MIILVSLASHVRRFRGYRRQNTTAKTRYSMSQRCPRAYQRSGQQIESFDAYIFASILRHDVTSLFSICYLTEQTQFIISVTRSTKSVKWTGFSIHVEI